MRTGMDYPDTLAQDQDAYADAYLYPTPPTPSHQPDSPLPSATAPLMPMPSPSVDSPAFPVASPATPMSPVMGSMPMSFGREDTMSPDAMLRVYATKAHAETNQFGMRVLYSPPSSPAPGASAGQSFTSFGAAGSMTDSTGHPSQ
jgi:hypothetical protein